MAAQDQCLFQREQGGAIINIKTGHVFKFNSTQLPVISNATTAATSSLAGAIAAINTLGELFNTLKNDLAHLGFHSTA